ncbi:uncharacterized protein [Pseudorasbora parva]|uniref:uncharacterized protein n=1 Tax=Pseudorasbora parva TaxID=51549 RepID=UPI00351E1A44
MAIMQTYQADLLRDLDGRDEVGGEVINELRQSADLALCATKETARCVSRSMAALVATERHLWLNPTEIKEFDAPVSPAGLFGDAYLHLLIYIIMISQMFCVLGSSGVDVDHVFISSGGNVRLSCNNALSDCTSTTWLYFNRFRHSELIDRGIKRKDTERHESLSLGSDCSLNINNVTIEDHGSYICTQYKNRQQQGTGARVLLHVLHASSSQTEISPGRSVTLSCQLYSYDFISPSDDLYSDDGSSCDDWVHSEDIELLWVNQAGVDLQTDSRYQISAPDRCIRTLTTTLLNEDHNREWRCEVTQRKQLKTSVTYTVKSSDDASEHSSSAVDSSTLIPVSSSNSQKKSSPTTSAAPTQDAVST